MELFDTLSDDNFLLYAAKHYYKPTAADAEEFYDDLKRFTYVKRQLHRYVNTGELSERLLLNHFIVIFNVYGIEPALKMLEFKVDEQYWPIIKPFLLFLKYIRNDQYVDVKMDQYVVDKLREI